MKTKITYESVEFWLGADDPLTEAIDVLTSIANGDYSPELFREEVLELKEDDESWSKQRAGLEMDVGDIDWEAEEADPEHDYFTTLRNYEKNETANRKWAQACK